LSIVTLYLQQFLIHDQVQILRKLFFQTPSKVFSNAKPYEVPKQTPTSPTFTSGYNQIQSGKLQA